MILRKKLKWLLIFHIENSSPLIENPITLIFRNTTLKITRTCPSDVVLATIKAQKKLKKIIYRIKKYKPYRVIVVAGKRGSTNSGLDPVMNE